MGRDSEDNHTDGGAHPYDHKGPSKLVSLIFTFYLSVVSIDTTPNISSNDPTFLL